ncbi:hypothetical protein SAMN05660862_2143 [Sphingobacterium psychroaquaticum]|uniref:Uncharacterized protein n=1 Tax=Sphingobacterium psychroaquaticum TaxID=561061 RepID=A0A1X7JT42_9SPHI|nr:hypothetical protein SAMN05660862_2143 [Sphingobacterium psychroaquaticum]
MYNTRQYRLSAKTPSGRPVLLVYFKIRLDFGYEDLPKRNYNTYRNDKSNFHG